MSVHFNEVCCQCQPSYCMLLYFVVPCTAPSDGTVHTFEYISGSVADGKYASGSLGTFVCTKGYEPTAGDNATYTCSHGVWKPSIPNKNICTASEYSIANSNLYVYTYLIRLERSVPTCRSMLRTAGSILLWRISCLNAKSQILMPVVVFLARCPAQAFILLWKCILLIYNF